MPSSRTQRVIVIGGGPSGLAAAHRALELSPSADVRVLEASSRPGGWLQTLVRDGFTIELGPDSIITDKPAALALAARLDLSSRLVRTLPANRGAYVVARGRLERVPDGFSLLAPVDAWAFLRSPILSSAGKARAGLDLLLPRREEQSEESLAGFVRRRMGPELLDRLAQPLVGGIYGSDAEVLSLDATMPRFPALERSERSLSFGLWKKQRAAQSEASSGARYGLFVAFDGGMRVLIDALCARLQHRVQLDSPALRVSRSGNELVVDTERESLRADAVIVALAAHRVAALLRAGDLDSTLCDGLDAIPHGSAATVTFAIAEAQFTQPLDAYGFVVPALERRGVLASTWASSKWPGRAPEGQALVRVFVGGMHDGDAAERSDDELVLTARRELESLMGLRGEPRFAVVTRYPRAMPLYQLGHRARARAISARAEGLAGVEIAGNGLFGVGIPDAIASGEAAAERALAATGAAQARES